MTTRCHSVRSWRLPSLSFQFSEVATRRFTTSPPLLSERLSGSSPRLPTRITLLTPAIALPSNAFRIRADDKRRPGGAPDQSGRGEPVCAPPIAAEADDENGECRDLRREAFDRREEAEHADPRRPCYWIQPEQPGFLERRHALACQHHRQHRDERRAVREELA